MKIIELKGGLADQLFQYIFYRYSQINMPDEAWIMDDSSFYTDDTQNSYELESVFWLHPDILSRYFDYDVWNYMLGLKKEQGKSIPQILLENGTDIKLVYESDEEGQAEPFTGEKIQTGYGKYDPDIIKLPGEVYYQGTWTAPEWLKNIKDTISEEINYPPVYEDANRRYLSQIQNSKACSIHVRRGDHVISGRALSDDRYLEKVKYMLDREEGLSLFVFSDDIAYCRAHAHEMGLDLAGETVYVEGNSGSLAFRDMQLMSQCPYMIIGDSAFGKIAALFNDRLQHLCS